MSIIIIILAVGGVWYFFSQKEKKETLSVEDKDRLSYFDKKYQKQLTYVDDAFSRIQKITELAFDLLNLHLIKSLIEEDPKRYDLISARHKAGEAQTDEYEEWIAESENTKIVNLRESKRLLSECSSLHADIFQLWEKAVVKHIKSHTEQELAFFLDDLQGACIYFDAFHSGVSKDKVLTDNKASELAKRLEKLHEELNDILSGLQERYFET
jgi:hypothetical protein